MIVPLRCCLSRVALALALAPLVLSPAMAAKESVFDADPASKGLLVADVKITYHSLFPSGAPVRVGSVILDSLRQSERLDRPFTAIEPTAGYLVFALDPERYHLHQVTSEYKMKTATMSATYPFAVEFLPDSLDDRKLSAQTNAGEVVYIGRVRVDSRPHMLSGEITSASRVEYDAKRELEVWRDVLKKAQKTAWAAAILKRIDALQAAGVH